MEARLLGSAEYLQTRGGSTNDGFLTALYGDVLARGPDTTERAKWDQALGHGTTRAQVAAALFASLEYDQDLVRSFYENFLRRPADSVGLSHFTGALQHGTTDNVVIAAILASVEYFTRP